MEAEAWHDLASVYISMSQWRDAEVCLSKSSAICPHSALGWHTKGSYFRSIDCFFSFLLSVIMYKIGLIIFHESSALAAKRTLEYLWCV